MVLAISFKPEPVAAGRTIPLAIVKHHWQEKITESNHAALRPGSIYDIFTYFEQNFGLRRPTFKYLFFDTGLGASDPIYPIFQEGYQGSWGQIIKAGFSEKNRHIDHYSEGETPEGCLIKSAYFVRHVDDLPELYKEERADGYTLVDISFDYYIKTKPDAECGRHIANDPDDNFDPFKEIKKYRKKFRTFDDIPADLLKKYEAKVGILKLVTEEFGKRKWPRYDKVYTPENNSLWYYPNGFLEDYGINTPRPQKELEHLNQALQLIMPASEELAREISLEKLTSQDDFQKLLNFWDGRPVPDFDANTEPGLDTFSLSQITSKNYYTFGTQIAPILDPHGDVSNRKNYRLVAAILHPFESKIGINIDNKEKNPQLRFNFQLVDPKDSHRPYENLHIELIFDVVDPLATSEVQAAQRKQCMKDMDLVTAVRSSDASSQEKDLAMKLFLHKYSKRPPQSIFFSTSLTGIWVWGQLSREDIPDGALQAVRIIRSGIDVGYYSSAYDTVLFRQEALRANGDRKVEIEKILSDLIPEFYRDPRRGNVHAINMERVTCAQCHQMAGRDGVHVGFNDRLDRRVKTSYRATEFTIRQLDRQLQELAIDPSSLN
jgi:hypothetical protein